MARHAVLDLFPTYMPIARLAQILRRVKEKPRSIGDLSYRLPREIETADLSSEYLDQLCAVLTELIIDGMTWERDKFPHLRTRRPDLIGALVAACRRQATEGVQTEAWIASSLARGSYLGRRPQRERGFGRIATGARGLYLPARARPPSGKRTLSWPGFISRKMHSTASSIFRATAASSSPTKRTRLGFERGSPIPSEPLERREMMLWIEMVVLNRGAADHDALLQNLETLHLGCTESHDDHRQSVEAAGRPARIAPDGGGKREAGQAQPQA